MLVKLVPWHLWSNLTQWQCQKGKYCVVWSWHNTNSQTANRSSESSFHLICIFSIVGWNWHTRVTLCQMENSAKHCTYFNFPCNQLDLPAKFSTDYKHSPPAVPESTCLLLSKSPPCCLYLVEIASQQALFVELCGFLKPSEPVEGSTPAQQTIAMAPIDFAGLWSGEGCELSTPGSVVSPHSLCDERRLWDESTRAFKDVQVSGWPAIPHQTRCSHENTNDEDVWRGYMLRYSSTAVWSTKFSSHSNWHWVRYQNRDSENIHMGERQIMEDDPRATVCLGWGGKTLHRQNFTFHTRVSQPHLISLPSVCGVIPLSNRPPKHKLAVKYDIIKSSRFFDYEESMNYSEATDGNIFLSILMLPSLSHRPLCFRSPTAALLSFFCLICSSLSLSLSFPSHGMSSTTVEGRSEERKWAECVKQGSVRLWLTGAKVDTSPLDRATTKSSEWKPWLVSRDIPSMPDAVSVSTLSSCG